MAKPIVIIAPERDREALRHAGALPVSFFRRLDPETLSRTEQANPSDNGESPLGVGLWPFDLNDRAVTGRFAGPNDRTSFFDYFGVQGTFSQEAKERVGAYLLKSILVHVVTLDADDADERFVRFKSFSEVDAWVDGLAVSLSRRFPNAPEPSWENVLVLVARGGQILTDEKELESLRSHIGHDRFFKACYFLDVNLHRDDVSPLFHSRDIWDVMVSRLLLAFALSVEKGEKFAPWNTLADDAYAIRIWRTLECRVLIDGNKTRECLTGFLEAALKQLGEGIKDDEEIKDDQDVEGCVSSLVSEKESHASSLRMELPELTPDFDPATKDKAQDGDKLNRSWRSLDEVSSWSEFSVDDCLKHTLGSESESGCAAGRWAAGYEQIRKKMHEWSLMCESQDGLVGIKDDFKKLGDSSTKLGSLIFSLKTRLKQTRDGEPLLADQVVKAWKEVVETENNGRKLEQRLKDEGEDLRIAQRHYVGWGLGLAVTFLAVAPACGWLLYRLVVALNGSFYQSLILSGAAVSGALLSCVIVSFAHWYHGGRGTQEFIKTSEACDQSVIDRDQCVRKMVEIGLQNRENVRKMSHQIVCISLLRRLEQILLMEIQPGTSSVITDLEDEMGNAADRQHGATSSERRDFIKATQKTISIAVSEDDEDKKLLQDRVNAWLGVAERGEDIPEGAETFPEVWHRICERDKNYLGYFPAQRTIALVRDFFAVFADDVKRFLTRCAFRQSRKDVQEQLNGWVVHIMEDQDFRKFASAETTGMHIRESCTLSSLYLNDDSTCQPSGTDIEGALRTFGGSWNRLDPVFCKSLNDLPTIGLLFQEYPVRLGCDKETGILRFEMVPDKRML